MPGSGLRRIVPEEDTLFELAFVGNLFIQEQRRSYNPTQPSRRNTSGDSTTLHVRIRHRLKFEDSVRFGS